MRLLSSFAALALAAASGAAAAMTGDKVCPTGQDWCIDTTYDGSAVSYNLTISKGGSQFGWRGIGMGTQMAGANMMVGWINSDLSVTLSQRSTSGEVQPTTAKVTAATFSPEQSFTDATMTSFAWKFPYTSTGALNQVQHIWSINPNTSPSSNSPSATILKHPDNMYGFFSLDLTKPLASDGTATASAAPTTGGAAPIRDTSLPSVKILLAHMVFMVLGWALIVPAGALVARYGRTYFNWKPVHRGIQYTAYLFVFIGFFLAVGWVSMYGGGEHFVYRHEKLGLALFILLSVQVILGEVGTRLFQAKGIRILNFYHIISGIIIFGLSIWNIHLGFALWKWQPPMYASYIIYGWTGFIFLLYVGGFALIPRERRLAKNADYNTPKSLGSDDQVGKAEHAA